MFIKNNGNRVDLRVAKATYKLGESVDVKIISNFGDRYEIVQNSRVLKSGAGREAQVKIPAKELGRGPVNLFVYSYNANEPEMRIQSVPVPFEIVGPISKEVPITSAALKKKLKK